MPSASNVPGCSSRWRRLALRMVAEESAKVVIGSSQEPGQGASARWDKELHYGTPRASMWRKLGTCDQLPVASVQLSVVATTPAPGPALLKTENQQLKTDAYRP